MLGEFWSTGAVVYFVGKSVSTDSSLITGNELDEKKDVKLSSLEQKIENLTRNKKDKRSIVSKAKKRNRCGVNTEKYNNQFLKNKQ